jgi:hypothetical protein
MGVPERSAPFIIVKIWNDHEEGNAIEGGLPNCNKNDCDSSLSRPLQ